MIAPQLVKKLLARERLKRFSRGEAVIEIAKAISMTEEECGQKSKCL